jgi:hypothetical protein
VARSEVSVLSAWQIKRTSANCSLRSGLLSDVSSVYLSYAFCKRSLMRENTATGFVRGAGHSFSHLLGIRFSNLNAPLVVQNHWLVLKKNCEFGRSWRCATTRSWGRVSWSANGSCFTSSSRTHPSISVLCAM